METTVAPPVARPAVRPRTGLALACLILGVLAVFGSLLVVGGVLGVLAILLGLIHIISRRGANGMAWGGIGLGLLSLVLSAGLALLYVKVGTFVGKPFAETYREMVARMQPAPAEAATTGIEAWIGVEAPDFTVTSLEGETFRMSELRGRRVVLNFWATWCPPCRMEVPHFIRLAQENPRDQLLILAISDEDEDTLRTFVKREKINYPVIAMEDVPAPFNTIAALPTTFFIDRRGIIQDVVVGYGDYDLLRQRALAADTRGDPKPAPGAGSGSGEDREGLDD